MPDAEIHEIERWLRANDGKGTDAAESLLKLAPFSTAFRTKYEQRVWMWDDDDFHRLCVLARNIEVPSRKRAEEVAAWLGDRHFGSLRAFHFSCGPIQADYFPPDDFGCKLEGRHKVSIHCEFDGHVSDLTVKAEIKAPFRARAVDEFCSILEALFGSFLAVGVATFAGPPLREYSEGPPLRTTIREEGAKDLPCDLPVSLSQAVELIRLEEPRANDLETARAKQGGASETEQRLQLCKGIFHTQEGDRLRRASRSLFKARTATEPGEIAMRTGMALECLLLPNQKSKDRNSSDYVEQKSKDRNSSDYVEARLKVAVSFLLGRTNSERDHYRDVVSEIYKKRSEYAHGGSVDDWKYEEQEKALQLVASVLECEITYAHGL